MSEKETGYRKITYEEWEKEGERRFGKDKMKWQFICPVCKHVALAEDWLKAGASEDTIAFSCIGRYLNPVRDAFSGKGKGPCNYAGGGLFRLNPVIISDGKEEHQVFEFAIEGNKS